MTFPHTLQERKGPFTCPRCGRSIRFVTGYGLAHESTPYDDEGAQACPWLDEATDEQVEALK